MVVVMTPEERAYIFLEVDPALVAAAPRISHLFEHIPDGEAGVWKLLAGCDNPDARKLLDVRARLVGRELSAIPFEGMAIAAGMSPRHAFGVISEALVEHSQDASRLILQAAVPDIMRKAVEHAKGDGVGERKTLLQAVNLVPRSKNTIVVHNGDVVKGNKATVSVLPPVADVGRRLANRFNMEMTLPALAAPVHDIEVIDPEDDDDGLDR